MISTIHAAAGACRCSKAVCRLVLLPRALAVVPAAKLRMRNRLHCRCCVCCPQAHSSSCSPVKVDAGHSQHCGPIGPLPIDPTLCSISTGSGTAHSSQHGPTAAAAAAAALADDAVSELAPSEYGGRVGSRLSMRLDGGWEGGLDDSSSSTKGTLKGMFKKQKRSKQIELDALRWGHTRGHASSWRAVMGGKACLDKRSAARKTELDHSGGERCA
jgi:hypothetical protein